MQHSVLGQSPSFVRQEFRDDDRDFKSYDEKTNAFRNADSGCLMGLLDSLDIKSVSYISDGKFLNATLWLYSEYVPKMTWEKLVYGMYVDVDSVYESGVDYIYNIYLNTKNNTWSSELVESSVPAAKITNLKKPTFTGDGYVDFSLDLKSLNYPSQYKVFFATGANFMNINILCELVDVTNFVSIPPPVLNVTTSPSILELRPGEERYVQIKLQSETKLDSMVALNLTKHEKLQMNFSTNRLSMLPFSTATSTLKIHALPNAQPESFSVPIFVNIDFPNATVATLGGKVSFENTVTPKLSNVVYYTVTILPELGFSDNLNLFVNSWITPLSGLWSFLAGVGAVMAPLVIRIYTKRKKVHAEESDVKTKR